MNGAVSGVGEGASLLWLSVLIAICTLSAYGILVGESARRHKRNVAKIENGLCSYFLNRGGIAMCVFKIPADVPFVLCRPLGSNSDTPLIAVMKSDIKRLLCEQEVGLIREAFHFTG